MKKILILAALAISFALIVPAQTRPPAGATARMILTVGHNYGQDGSPLVAADLTINHGIEKLALVGLTPLRGAQDSPELFVVVDNCSSCEVGPKFDELRKFLTARTPATKIGVAYIQDGLLKIAQNPTTDHERALKVLNPPAGSKPSNPFRAVAELIEKWPADSNRRVILMISNGVDPSATEGSVNRPAEAAIEAAQRAGVLIYSIYHPNADYATADFSQMYGGQIQLAHVSAEAGGESYLLGFGPLPSLAPFLSDIAHHLANQYLLEFIVNPEDGTGSFQDIDVRSKIRELEILSPARIWVPGRGSSDLKTRYSSGNR